MTTTKGVLDRSQWTKLEMWRVFLLDHPARFTDQPFLEAFHGVLAENLTMGIRVVVHKMNKIDPRFNRGFSDFLCVPGEVACLSAAPHYLLRTFTKLHESDKTLITYFSEFSDSLIQAAQNRNCSDAFCWTGSPLETLRNQLIS
jgi:hypothetical protein